MKFSFNFSVAMNANSPRPGNADDQNNDQGQQDVDRNNNNTTNEAVGSEEQALSPQQQQQAALPAPPKDGGVSDSEISQCEHGSAPPVPLEVNTGNELVKMDTHVPAPTPKMITYPSCQKTNHGDRNSNFPALNNTTTNYKNKHCRTLNYNTSNFALHPARPARDILLPKACVPVETARPTIPSILGPQGRNFKRQADETGPNESEENENERKRTRLITKEAEPPQRGILSTLQNIAGRRYFSLADPNMTTIPSAEDINRDITDNGMYIVEDLTVIHATYGKVQFLGTLNLRQLGERINLSDYIVFLHGGIQVMSPVLQSQPLRVTLTNMTVAEFIRVNDGDPSRQVDRQELERLLRQTERKMNAFYSEYDEDQQLFTFFIAPPRREDDTDLDATTETGSSNAVVVATPTTDTNQDSDNTSLDQNDHSYIS